MNSYEKSLATMSVAQMGETEYLRIRELTADMKRVADLLMLIPGEADELKNDPRDFANRHGLKLTEYDLQYTFSDEYANERAEAAKSNDFLDRVPESFFRYSQFIGNKMAFRDYLLAKGCVPANEKMAKWRLRQINRCMGSIGGMNKSFIHAPVCIELADGCSVGCDFCGLGATRLKSIYRYNQENAKIFKDVLQVIKDVIGQGACFGMMYFATEALDNPDYEQFENDYYDVFNYIPQITTAVPDRDIERTRRLIGELNEKQGYVHRFSLRSLDTAKKILDSFSPLELLNVELIPQYKESPSFVPYTQVGNEAKKENDNKSNSGNANDPGTICCIDGFCVNFAKKTIKLFTPCHMDEKNPDGIAIACEKEFTDANDFADILKGMIEEYMISGVPKDEPLKLYDYFELTATDKGEALKSIHGGEVLSMTKLPKDYGKMVIDLLLEGTYTKREIGEMAYDKYGTEFENTFWLINQLWDKGFIQERKFFG